MTADVVIVGGGLTGCATAYAFAAAGVKVVLLEAAQVGRGSTAVERAGFPTSRAWPFGDLETTIGARVARRWARPGGARRSTSPRCCAGST